jgi:hypothetical protein
MEYPRVIYGLSMEYVQVPAEYLRSTKWRMMGGWMKGAGYTSGVGSFKTIAENYLPHI